MPHRRLAGFALLSLLASTAGAADESPRRTPPAPVFNGVLFEEQVRAGLGGVVKGYAFAVADRNGVIQASAAGGWAQDPADGNVLMSTAIPSGIGSVTKMMSSAALLHLFERRALSNTTVAAQLDTPMLGKLPPKWQQQWRGRNLERVTYRHLMQHQSGFRDKDCEGKNLEPLEHMAAGAKLEDIGKLRCYNNFNIYLLRYLIPAIAYPADAAAIHKKHENLSLEDYTEKLNVEMSLQFERFMRDEFFPRSLNPFVASCRPQKDLPAKGVALGYADKGSRKGAFTNTRDEHVAAGDYCPTQGSWYLSAEGLALFGRNLLYTDRWVSPATRRLMFDAASSNERFPWSRAFAHDGLGKETGQSLWPGHGGDQNGYHAALLQLPYGLVGAALVNSSERNSTQIGSALIDAVYAATRGEPVARARHGLTAQEYQSFVSELDESAHRVDWIDFYNVGEKVFVNVIVHPAGERGKNYLRHNLSPADYQKEIDEHVKSGKRRLLLVDSYLDRSQLRYAFVMGPGDGRDLPAYHGADAATHKKLFDDYSARGFVPTSVSVVSLNGERRFATSWARGKPGGLVVRSTLDGREFQQLADEMAGKKMELSYLNTYVHQGEVQYSVVFVEHIDRPQVWKHGLGEKAYQTEFAALASKGFGLKLVAGAGAGTKHHFAAVWQR